MRHTKTILTAAILSAALLSAQACARADETSHVAAPQTPPSPRAVTPSTTATPSTVVDKDATQPDLARHFEQFPGTFVLYDLKRDRYVRHDPARAAARFSPFSTFKIPNSLIGLETGVIKDADFLIKWDAEKYPREGQFDFWWRDHTLRSAFRNSVVWYYRELATRVGEQRMREFVNKFRYGNQDISGGVDRFWLNSSLRISADEQVEFLKTLYREELPVSKRTYAVFKDIFVNEEGMGYKLSGKTGSGPFAEGRFLGWFVGYLETKDNAYVFATQIEGPTFASIRDERLRITKSILTDLGHLPGKK
ncbi:MAG TPA: penicillin-binding transpeptidase domain-containing protein [Pyrinomonadaceae bacterium]